MKIAIIDCETNNKEIICISGVLSRCLCLHEGNFTIARVRNSLENIMYLWFGCFDAGPNKSSREVFIETIIETRLFARGQSYGCNEFDLGVTLQGHFKSNQVIVLRRSSCLIFVE